MMTNSLKPSGARQMRRAQFFPLKRRYASGYKFCAIIGVGGNVGGVSKTCARFSKFLRIFMNDVRFYVVESSPILINAAFGFKDQTDFANAVLNVQTSLAPSALLKALLRYETKFKRQRSFKNAPRTLDLDILYIDTKVRKSERLNVPHPHAQERVSVVVPMGILRSIA